MSNNLIEKIFLDLQETLKNDSLIGPDLAMKFYEAMISEEFSKEKLENILINQDKNENPQA